jgi:hypothetical protein
MPVRSSQSDARRVAPRASAGLNNPRTSEASMPAAQTRTVRDLLDEREAPAGAYNGMQTMMQ